MKRGLLLDLDGTLADSLDFLREVYQNFLKTYNCVGSDSEFETINGPSLDRVVEILKEKHSLEETAQNLLFCYSDLVRKHYLTVAPHAGAREVLKAATECGWSCGVVTSNSEGLAREWLASKGLLTLVKNVTGKESVVSGKPDPEPYLTALKKLGCEAHLSLAVEDSYSGFLSASGAGIRTFVFQTSPQKWSVNMTTVARLTDIIPRLTHA